MIEYYTIHTKWYWDRYLVHSGNTKTYKEAWERTEEEHRERFEFNKYEDYTQFRTAKSVYFNKVNGPKDKHYDPDQMRLFE